MESINNLSYLTNGMFFLTNGKKRGKKEVYLQNIYLLELHLPITAGYNFLNMEYNLTITGI